MSKKEMHPPIAERIPKELSIHGDQRIDDYYWLNQRENPDHCSRSTGRPQRHRRVAPRRLMVPSIVALL